MCLGSGSELALGITILINNDNTGCYVRRSGILTKPWLTSRNLVLWVPLAIIEIVVPGGMCEGVNSQAT